MIYFIQAEKLKLIKIGYTSKESPHSRLKSLQNSSPDKLHLVGILDLGSKEGEFFAHKLFGEYHSHNEWYHPGERLVKFIEAIDINQSYWLDKIKCNADFTIKLAKGIEEITEEDKIEQEKRAFPFMASASGRSPQ